MLFLAKHLREHERAHGCGSTFHQSKQTEPLLGVSNSGSSVEPPQSFVTSTIFYANADVFTLKLARDTGAGLKM